MGEGAFSPVIGLIVAIVIYSVAFVAMTNLTAEPQPSSDEDAADFDSKASEVLDVILSDPGFTLTGAAAWEDDPDNLDKFGLATPDDPNVLHYDKIQKLRDAKETRDPDNGIADYPEVRDALGLPEAYDFHIRSYPLFMSVDDATWTPYKDLEVAFLAHGESGTTPTGDATVTSTVTNHSDHLRVDVTVTNPSTETASMIYKLAFELQMGGAVVSVDDQYTGLLAPGESQTVTQRYYEVTDWAGAGTVEVTVYDGYSNTLDTRAFADMAFPEDNSPVADYNLLVDPSGYYFVDGQDTPAFYLDSYDGDGVRVKQGNSGPTIIVAVEDPSGAEVENETVTLNHNKATDWSCDACSGTGMYTVKVMTDDATPQRVVVDHFHVSSGALFDQTKTMTNAAEFEAGLIEELAENFQNGTYDAETGNGDIFIDDKDVLRDHLVPNLANYDVLIVGSNVDHSELTGGGIKWPIHDWVTEDGGSLIVLGNVAPNVQWLQPLYGSGVTTANGGISTPDPTHPILHTPEQLRYSTYDNHGKAWKLTSNAEDYYTHVIKADGGGGSSNEDVLAASKPGAFGNGTVVLSAYIPNELTNPPDRGEALKLLNNMVSHSYNMVFIDFGPQIPEGATVSSESRIAMVPHTSLPEAQVEVKVVVYVWQ